MIIIKKRLFKRNTCEFSKRSTQKKNTNFNDRIYNLLFTIYKINECIQFSITRHSFMFMHVYFYIKH